eukprot:GHVS01005908.1.p1 GENE.GHVS01005908.1~~GHVS01005908.1.p1  ORF type:complete len:1112 (-),score=247.76 GHVS01005908.1:315-3215(-)
MSAHHDADSCSPTRVGPFHPSVSFLCRAKRPTTTPSPTSHRYYPHTARQHTKEKSVHSSPVVQQQHQTERRTEITTRRERSLNRFRLRGKQHDDDSRGGCELLSNDSSSLFWDETDEQINEEISGHHNISVLVYQLKQKRQTVRELQCRINNGKQVDKHTDSVDDSSVVLQQQQQQQQAGTLNTRHKYSVQQRYCCTTTGQQHQQQQVPTFQNSVTPAVSSSILTPSHTNATMDGYLEHGLSAAAADLPSSLSSCTLTRTSPLHLGVDMTSCCSTVRCLSAAATSNSTSSSTSSVSSAVLPLCHPDPLSPCFRPARYRTPPIPSISGCSAATGGMPIVCSSANAAAVMLPSLPVGPTDDHLQINKPEIHNPQAVRNIKQLSTSQLQVVGGHLSVQCLPAGTTSVQSLDNERPPVFGDAAVEGCCREDGRETEQIAAIVPNDDIKEVEGGGRFNGATTTRQTEKAESLVIASNDTFTTTTASQIQDGATVEACVCGSGYEATVAKTERIHKRKSTMRNEDTERLRRHHGIDELVNSWHCDDSDNSGQPDDQSSVWPNDGELVNDSDVYFNQNNKCTTSRYHVSDNSSSDSTPKSFLICTSRVPLPPPPPPCRSPALSFLPLLPSTTTRRQAVITAQRSAVPCPPLEESVGGGSSHRSPVHLSPSSMSSPTLSFALSPHSPVGNAWLSEAENMSPGMRIVGTPSEHDNVAYRNKCGINNNAAAEWCSTLCSALPSNEHMDVRRTDIDYNTAVRQTQRLSSSLLSVETTPVSCNNYVMVEATQSGTQEGTPHDSNEQTPGEDKIEGSRGMLQCSWYDRSVLQTTSRGKLSAEGKKQAGVRENDIVALAATTIDVQEHPRCSTNVDKRVDIITKTEGVFGRDKQHDSGNASGGNMLTTAVMEKESSREKSQLLKDLTEVNRLLLSRRRKCDKDVVVDTAVAARLRHNRDHIWQQLRELTLLEKRKNIEGV